MVTLIFTSYGLTKHNTKKFCRKWGSKIWNEIEDQSQWISGPNLDVVALVPGQFLHKVKFDLEGQYQSTQKFIGS